MQYPFKPGPVKPSDLIALVASTAYPDDDQKDARKRVRATVQYAVQRKRELTLAATIDPEAFFAWAVPKWPELLNIPGLPYKPIISAALGIASHATLKGFGMAIPSNMEELKQRYVECETRCWRLDNENSDLKARIEAMEAELTEWRTRAADRSQKASRAGKKGGRGKTY